MPEYQTLKTHRLAPLSGQEPQSVIIFLHGLGDSGSGGLLDLGRMWQRILPNTEFLCPDAPFIFDMAPDDFGGRQWFSLREYTVAAIDRGVRIAAPILNAYIDHVLTSRSLKANRLALVGFSQGTMMALHVALRRAEAVAAVVGYSGKLTCLDSLAQEKTCQMPILLVHGTADEVVPFAMMAEASQHLNGVGVEVQTLVCPNMGHSIDQDGLQAGLDLLRTQLAS